MEARRQSTRACYQDTEVCRLPSVRFPELALFGNFRERAASYGKCGRYRLVPACGQDIRSGIGGRARWGFKRGRDWEKSGRLGGECLPTLVPYDVYMAELVFEVVQEADGGYCAECLTENIFTEGNKWDELRRNVV